MLQRYLAVGSIVALMSGLSWWSDHHRGNEPQSLRTPTPTAYRGEVIETLHRLAQAEQQYRATHGHFTRLIQRLSFTPPQRLATEYEFHVQEASATHLIITAFSERNGQREDFISIDQNFELKANFTIPTAARNRQLASLQSSEKILEQLISTLPGTKEHHTGQHDPAPSLGGNQSLVIEPL